MTNEKQTIKGMVQTGLPRLVIEQHDATGIYYRIEADVQAYFGLQPKAEGQVYVMCQSRAWAYEDLKELEARLARSYNLHATAKTFLWQFSGPAERWPYAPAGPGLHSNGAQA